MSELKPCPFCGGEADTQIFDKVLNVGCPHCDIRTRFMLHDELDAAIEAWNTRHVETDPLREACREIVAYAGTCPFDAKDTDTANWSERCDRECSTDVDMAACWMRYFMEVER